MAHFGWAYVDCSESGSQAYGPTGSLQFVTGADGNTTGSWNLIFYTGSDPDGSQPAHLVLSGNLKVTGAISASAFHYQDITHIDATGSTFFGNDVTDIHVRSGSLSVYGLTNAGSTGFYTLSASSDLGSAYVRGFGGNYRLAISASNTSASVAYDDYVIGISSSHAGPFTLQLRSGSLHPAGQTLIIKNESQHASAAQTVSITTWTTQSTTATHLIEGDTSYSMNGTMAAISLYTDGTNWFIF
jgi:hypothetical protein